MIETEEFENACKGDCKKCETKACKYNEDVLIKAIARVIADKHK